MSTDETGAESALPSKFDIINAVVVDDYSDTVALHAAIEELRDLKLYTPEGATEYAQVVRRRDAAELGSQRKAAQRLGRSRAAVRGGRSKKAAAE
jgi:hypothetical protein